MENFNRQNSRARNKEAAKADRLRTSTEFDSGKAGTKPETSGKIIPASTLGVCDEERKTQMSDGDYKYTTTKPVSSRDDYRMRLFMEVYLLWVNAQAGGRAISGS